MTRLAALLLCGALAASLPVSVFAFQEPSAEPSEAPTPADAATPRELLDAIREDLVGLRFEKALAALEPLVVSPALTEEERIEAMVLRSQTRAAFGDLDATEEDYRQILLRRPGWAPDPSLTPRKAMDRFESVSAKLIGRVNFVLDPADAALWVDDREIQDLLEALPLLAGSHEVHAARQGHDPLERTVEVKAGQTATLTLTLMANARTVVVRTEPADVEVWLDGELAGTTRPAERFAGIARSPAELVIEDVPLGEHHFELRKECHRTERITDALNIDLLDRAPKRYDIVRLPEALVMIVPTGGPQGSELRIDGVRVAVLPVESVQACPGRRRVEAIYAERVVWSEDQRLVEGVPATLEISARPNLVLVGMQSLPRALAALESHVNLRRIEGPAGADYENPSAWNRLDLERGTDLAIAAVAGDRQGVAPTWWLYSPVLHTVERLLEAPVATAPEWTRRLWGLTVVDDGEPLVLASTAGGPDAGSRLLSVGGRHVVDSAGLREALAAAGSTIDARWRAPDGTAVEATLRSRRGPWLRERTGGGIEDALRAAWAVVASESGSSDGASALANLALLFAAYGEHELALRTWRRVRWPQRAGIGAGTVDYYVGRELQALGRDREAVESFRRAATGAATAHDDEGPPIAPAARDRLADLGEAP